jgi:hypothetical protein
MTEEQTADESPVLIPESLEILKSKLSMPGYTDKQLNRAAMFLTAPVLSLGYAMGVADETPLAIMSTANLVARTVLADFINKGCLSVTAIDRYLTEAEKLVEEAEAKKTEDATV